jgi:hypothetical protein
MEEQKRNVLQLAQFERAFAALQEAIDTDDGDKKSRDSILLSFVFSFEMACKSMRSALALLGMNVADYASAILRGAFQARLFDEPAPGRSCARIATMWRTPMTRSAPSRSRRTFATRHRVSTRCCWKNCGSYEHRHAFR